MENMEPLINLSSASEDTPVKSLYNSLGYIVPELSLTNGQSEALIKTKEWFKQISNPSKRSQTSPLFYIAAYIIGLEKRTRRTEPSKYPEEKKSTEIP